jgi:alkylation response protein AidB-like acyl-CoA dehydrogenase
VDFAMPDDVLALQREARAVAAAAVDNQEIREDSWVCGFSKPFSRELGERGWLGMTLPRAVGGHGRTSFERFVVTEALISAGAPIAASWMGDRQIGPTLVSYGTPELVQRFVPGIVRGTETWCLGLSEPDAGSDLASVRTRAVLDGDEWVVDGAKVWTSGAADGDYLYAICRTDPDAPAHRGLSEIIVPLDAPGVTIAPIRDMTDARHFCEVTLEAVRAPAGNLVGALHGSWRQVMRQLEHERGGVDRLVSNLALYRDALDEADRTDPLVRQRVADIEAGLRTGRLLVIREMLGQAPAGSSAVTKAFCTELEQRIATFVAAVGPQALLAGRRARAVCYAPAYTIQGGTSEILRNIIGERVLGLPR